MDQLTILIFADGQDGNQVVGLDEMVAHVSVYHHCLAEITVEDP